MKLDEITQKEKKDPNELKLSILPSKKIFVDEVSSDQTLNQLYMPKTANFVAFDAWIPGIGAFQMTVGKTHDIKGGKATIDNLTKLEKEGSNKLFWLLPPLYYKTFTKKTPQEIDQYALLIPYSE